MEFEELQKQMEQQDREFEEMLKQFEELNKQFDDLLKANNLTESDLENIDENTLPDKEKAEWKRTKEAIACNSKAHTSSNTPKTSTAGRGRKNAIRL